MEDRGRLRGSGARRSLPLSAGRRAARAADDGWESACSVGCLIGSGSAGGGRAGPAGQVGRFGRIDVLVNNAGNFSAGYFEEITPDQMRRQIETNLFGPMNVTRAVLPIMRKQRDGHVITLSSSAGLIGQEFCVAYAASKFGVEGWMESLRYDIEPFGIRTTVV